MSTITVMLSVSLDGYFQGVDGDLSWHLVDEELHSEFNAVLAGMGAFLDGRVMHEMMAQFWPTADSPPEDSPAVIEFAKIWRDKPKIVYSRSRHSAEWSTAVVPDVVPEEVRALQEQYGDLAVGGADLAASFLEHDLLDEFRLYVHPVVIGAGRRLFPAGRRFDFRLLESHAFGNGVVRLRYGRG